jgi:beta-glucosidase
MNFAPSGSVRSATTRRIAVLAVAIIVAACGSSTATPTAGTSAGTSGSTSKPWMAAGLTVDQRVAALLSAMTLDEKIGQMTQVQNKDRGQMRSSAQITTGFIGSVLSGGDGNPQGD